MKEVLTGRERILQEEFVKFQSFYCFESEFCGPAKGNEKGSILINSNLEFAEWNKIFQYERMTAAIIDRLIHNSKMILFNGGSYRYRNRRQEIKGN